LRAVKHVSAQFALVLIALLAIAPFASAKTTTTPKHHSTSTTVKSSSTKSGSSSKKAHHSSVNKTSSRSSHSKHGKSTRVAKKNWKSKGQHGITSDRTREIQEALIRQHYLDGEANGVWDTRTQEACRKFQADNKWQTKVLPDSRALIKLGLGPDHKDVLNPETAATSPYLPGGGVKSEQ
jgi:Putative peptidoglycan binding domain